MQFFLESIELILQFFLNSFHNVLTSLSHGTGLVFTRLAELRLFRSSKRDADISRGPNELPIHRNGLDTCTSLVEGYRHDGAGLQCHHFACLAAGKGPNSTCSEIGTQHSIKSVRRAPALKVSENHATRLFSR